MMNRNTNSKFSTAPLDIDIDRSKYLINHTHKTTFNASYLVPIDVLEVLPGDTFDMTQATLCRMSTPIFPVADDCFLDLFWFFCPNRLLWDHWKEFMGENNVSAWTDPSIVYEVPTLDKTATVKGYKYSFGGVGDHMGIPPGFEFLQANVLPLRAYRLIWNEWFRDQNLQDPLLVNTGDTETDATLDNLLKVCKVHDYFTSALPAPQKGPDVLIPFSAEQLIFVNTTDAQYLDNNNIPLLFNMQSNVETGFKANMGIKNEGVVSDGGAGGDPWSNGKVIGGPATYSGTNVTINDNIGIYNPRNLVVDSSSFANAVGTINQLRTAFQIQKLYERDARSGTRYVESIKAHFGVTAPDASLQRPQYLGGERINITINQVVQTSATNDTSPQGNVAAYSKTVSKKHHFTTSFYEHGYVIGLACVRTVHTYQQGLNRMWSRKTRLDFYTPELANIGEQPILNKEIYVGYRDPAQTAWDPENDEVFGYQEAWADYRYKPSIVTGMFRSNSNNAPTLDAWTYADYFDERPYLSAEFIEETDKNIERTLAVSSDLADQFLLDMYFELYANRPMPLYSIPGLADHH